ncbi:hypothetical protein [Oscillibacter sp.]|nr:hypothetical protein [Oscillibacter sp.]
MKIAVLNVDADGTQTLLEKEVPEDFFEVLSAPRQEEAHGE